jgi:hypothetical protein
MTIQITNLHKEDAWYPYRDEIIGLQGETVGRVVSTGDSWYNLTFITPGNQEIGFAFCQFIVVKG